MKLHSHSQQLFLLFFRPGKQLQELLPGDSLNNCSCLPPKQPGTATLPGAACRTIVLSLPPRQPDTPNNFSSCTRQPGSEPRTRTKKKPAAGAASLFPEQFTPEQATPRRNPRPSPTPQGVFWVLFVFFVIFCYINHII